MHYLNFPHLHPPSYTYTVRFKSDKACVIGRGLGIQNLQFTRNWQNIWSSYKQADASTDANV